MGNSSLKVDKVSPRPQQPVISSLTSNVAYQWRTHKGVWGSNLPPLTIEKYIFFETIRLFSYRDCQNCCHCFSVLSRCYLTCLLISRNFHCDAINPVKLVWRAALEPTTNSNCKPGQSHGVLLKLESCCGVIKPLLSRAIMAGQWTPQRSSAEGILGREWMQRWQMFRLRCHNFELTKPASWG